jgi:acyl-coenzyme A thioesterase PaaI-like protein
MDVPLERPRLSEGHYINLLAIEVEMASPEVRGHAPVRAESFVPGTRRMRTGVLATIVDLVGGHVPTGPLGPTVDLRVELWDRPPEEGRVHLLARPCRVGARLVVAETLLSSAPGGAPFGRATTTFINESMGDPVSNGARPVLPMAEASFDEFLAFRVRDARSLAVDPVERISNGVQFTVQGGVQALLAEVAADHFLRRDVPLVATDLDIRFLSRLRVGPLVAIVEERPARDGTVRARVTVADGGNDDKVVSSVALTMAPA